MTAMHRRRRGIRGEQGSLLTILVMPIHSATMSACDAPTREQSSWIIRVTWDRGGHCARLDDHIPPQHIEGQTSLRPHFITKRMWGNRNPMLLDASSIPAAVSTC